MICALRKYCCKFSPNCQELRKNQAQPRRLFKISRLSITGRVAVFLGFVVILPMIATSWMIESGYLMPGKNAYIAIPLVCIVLLIPVARVLADFFINRTLKNVNKFCLEIKRGNYSVYFDLENERDDEDELRILLRNLTWMSHGLKVKQDEVRTRLKSAQQKALTMTEKARTDKLTGLFNRGYFDTLLVQKGKVTAIEKNQLSLIFMDCDKFKQVNDTLGHQVGDMVLKRLAESIRSGIRLSSDVPFRFGGDEFAIIMPATDTDAAMVVAERIHKVFGVNNVGKTTLSIGIASSRFYEGEIEAQVEELIKAADQQTYRVKKRGGDGTSSIELSRPVRHKNNLDKIVSLR